MYISNNGSDPGLSGSRASSTETSYVYGQNGSWLRWKPKEISASQRNSVISSSEAQSMTDDNELSTMEGQHLERKKVMLEGVDELQDDDEAAHVPDSSMDENGQHFDSVKITSSKLDNSEIDQHIQNVGNTLTIDVHGASHLSKYDRYHCSIDRFQGDKSVEIPILTFQRPHMRAFHFAWISFFTAFFTWFAIAPLLKEIKATLGLDHDQIWLSNVMNSSAAIACRLFVGPLCDAYGARWVMASVLIISAIPVMATGLVQTANELYILRFFTGIAGASFVVSQYWTSSMFTKEISGTANSLVAGWGNLGGAFAQLVMGSALFPLFKLFYSGPNGTEFEKVEAAEKAWRIVCVVPALLSLIMAAILLKYSDDLPKGNVSRVRRLGQMPSVQVSDVAKEAAFNWNTWILALHYGCSFGVEVTMTAGAALFFSETFDLSTESAAAIASIFGWLNLFARGLGGFTSDILNVKLGMRGRLLFQMATLIFQGMFLLVFSYTKTLGGAIGVMIAFSLFVQLGEVRSTSI
jgi:NNP family nitrate/nitrite transporter-like MFS transporter